MINYINVLNADLFERRKDEGKLTFIDRMVNVSPAVPFVEYDFEELFGKYVCVTGHIQALTGEVVLEICNTKDGTYSQPYTMYHTEKIDLGIFNAIRKIRISQAALGATTTYWLLAA